LKGKVIAVGNGTKDEEMVLKEGDEVLYGKYAGTEVELRSGQISSSCVSQMSSQLFNRKQ
jgi:co-chaperonin GroES (HSP10)